MNYNIRFVQNAFLREYEKGYVSQIETEVRDYGEPHGCRIVNDPARADLVVVLQSAQYKTAEYIKTLENDPVIRDCAERVYTIDYDDHPEGLLPGLYTSIAEPFYDPKLHRSWPILFMNNALTYQLEPQALFGKAPTRLFSFIGAASHPLRVRLYELYGGANDQQHVQIITAWYNHSEQDRIRFIETALDSHFCLCPRGFAAYTNRIVEVMAMARVPVIIADDWVPFSFSETEPYYIKIQESDIEKVPLILGEYRDRAVELGSNARRLWERHCSLQSRIVGAFGCIADLAARPDSAHSYAELRQRWHSYDFLWHAGWTRRQQLALRLEQRVRRWVSNARVPGVTDFMRSESRKPPTFEGK